MVVFRIARSKYIRDLSGTGAKRFGGRWNPKGLAVLYTSKHRSLAILELLVNANMQALPDDLSLLKLNIPDHPESSAEISVRDLPKNWRSSPAPFNLAEIGGDWISSGSSLTLTVPSAVVPEEQNILINPNHPEAKHLSVQSISSFSLDSRLLQIT